MDLSLTRQTKNSWGIISLLTDADGNTIATTLEHAYIQPDGTYDAKIQSGIYTCNRGQHQND